MRPGSADVSAPTVRWWIVRRAWAARLRRRFAQVATVVVIVAVSTGFFVVAAADSTNDQIVVGWLTAASVAPLPWPAAGLMIGALYATNVLAMDVYARHAEIRLLARLGWTPGDLMVWLGGEAVMTGLVAGALAAGLTASAAAVAGIALGGFGPVAVALVVPVVVFAAAVVVPGWRMLRMGARPAPIRVLGPMARRAGPWALAWANVWRSPDRSGIAVVIVALGAVGVVPVVIAMIESPGLDGRAAARAIAVTVMLGLGATAIAHVLYVDARDRRREFVALHVIGWADARVRMMVLMEAGAVGVAGAAIGAAAAVVAAVGRQGELRSSFLAAAGVSVLAVVAALIITALVPALVSSRWRLTGTAGTPEPGHEYIVTM